MGKKKQQKKVHKEKKKRFSSLEIQAIFFLHLQNPQFSTPPPITFPILHPSPEKSYFDIEHFDLKGKKGTVKCAAS